MKQVSKEIFNPAYRQHILVCIESFLTTKQSKFSLVNTWGKDLHEKLLPFISNGKLLRGSLVLSIYEAYTSQIPIEAVQAAAAMELFHSSFLIHDDIMDNDRLRRGQPTIFAQYQSFAEENKFTTPQHFGESMGMCVGDIGFFLGFQLLSSMTNPTLSQTITALCTREFVNVGLAQMEDVYFGYTQDEITEVAIEKVYTYKTGRYTFSVPMMIGALLAKQNKKTVNKLEKLGEVLGLIFQLQDDTLSLFGTEKITGKPEGSDIRENKKTLYRLYLFEKASSEEKQKLETIFGNAEVTTYQLIFVRECIERLGIQKIIDKKIQTLHKKAKANILDLSIPEVQKNQLESLLAFISERKN